MRRAKVVAVGERLAATAAKGGAGDAEARRHGQAGGGHEAEAETFAADGVGVGGRDLVEGAEVGHAFRSSY